MGVHWDPNSDCFLFLVNLRLCCKKRSKQKGKALRLKDIEDGLPVQLTKRLILSWINGLFDPLGLVAPFIIRAKMLMKKLWLHDNTHLDWDDPVSSNLQSEWHQLFLDMFEIQNIYFKRCVKPHDVSAKQPTLLIFCDSSEAAFGACAYVRWQLKNGLFESRLLIAKTHVAPINTISIVKLEVNAATLGARLKTMIEKESRIAFDKTYLIVDSEITLGFNVTRIKWRLILACV